jgi:hypothetical protein
METVELRLNHSYSAGTAPFGSSSTNLGFGFSSRRCAHFSLKSSTRTFSPLTTSCQRTKDISSLNLYIMSEIRRKLVIVGDGACGKVSIIPCPNRGRARLCVLMRQDEFANGILFAPGILDLLVDRLLERNFP